MEEPTYTSQALKNLLAELTCKICHNVTKNPHAIDVCGHFACRTCLLSLPILQCIECSQVYRPCNLVPDSTVKTILDEWNVINDIIRGSNKDNSNEVTTKKNTKDVNKLIKSKGQSKIDDINYNNKVKDVIVSDRSSVTRKIVNNANKTILKSVSFQSANKESKKADVKNTNYFIHNKENNNTSKGLVTKVGASKDLKVFPNLGKDGTNTTKKNTIVKRQHLELKQKSDRKDSFKPESVSDVKTLKTNDVDKNILGTNGLQRERSDVLPSEPMDAPAIDSTHEKEIVSSSDTNCQVPLPSKKLLKRKASNIKSKRLNSSTTDEEDFLGFDVKIKTIQSVSVVSKHGKELQSKQAIEEDDSDNFKTLRPVLKRIKFSSPTDKEPICSSDINLTSSLTNGNNKSTNENNVSNSCDIVLGTPQRNTKKRKSKSGSNEVIQKVDDVNENKDSNLSDCSFADSSITQVSSKSSLKRNKKGETPLQVACGKEKLDLVRSLLDAGADPNTKDYAGWTPLHEAVEKGNVVMVEMLLEAGAYVNAPGYLNITPLLEAVIKDNLLIARLLLQRGADTSLRSRYNYLPRHCAESEDMKKLLNVYEIKNSRPMIEPDPKECPMVTPATLTGVALDGLQSKLLKQFCRTFNLSYVESYRNDVSYVIVNDKGFLSSPLNITVLRAILNGSAIISIKWIEECSKESTLLDSDKWEINGTDDFPGSNISIKGRYCKQKLLPKLLDGVHVYLTQYWPKSQAFTKLMVTDLLREGGAVVLSREPDPESIPDAEVTVMFHADPEGPMSNCSHVILYVPGTNEPQIKYNMKHVKTLPLQWLLNCIQTFKIVDSVP